MQQTLHPSWIEIDLKELERNIYNVKKYIGNVLYCLPVKANAYGHGIVEIGKLAEKTPIDYLAVACLQEALLLRKAGIQKPIIVFGPIYENQIETLLSFNLEFTISSMLKAKWVEEKCKTLNKSCRVHLEVDTGIQRTGVRPETAIPLIEYLKNTPCFEIAGIYSHFAISESAENDFTKKQIESFEKLKAHPAFSKISCLWHLANSGGVSFYPSSFFDMVRPSLLTLGYAFEDAPNCCLVKPCFSLKSQVSYFKVVKEGTGISYNHLYTTKKQSRIVTVPVGYGDGFPRSLSNKASVLIRGKRYPIAGIICMDQFMVDIGDGEAYVGDEVVLIGKQGSEEITVLELAKLADSNPREILCMLNDRLPRKYLS